MASMTFFFVASSACPAITLPILPNAMPYPDTWCKYRMMIDTLLSRASVSDFDDPGPNDAELQLILAAAVRAPDHGKLRPWRFFVIRGEARDQLSELFAAALTRREHGATEKQIAKEQTKPLRSPLTIAVAARVTPDHKIPPVEQVFSAAAAAM